MDIFEYILKYGKYSFEEISFNEVDNVIFSMLSYLDLDGIVSSNSKNKISIMEVGKIYFLKYSFDDRYISSVRDAMNILKSICDKKRYKDIVMYNYCYIGDDSQQFSSVCLDILPNLTFISFEGTDHLISGWKEDFCMSYMFPVLSQKRAIRYVNKHFTFSSRRLILGGHSKGGNLAMVAGMYCNFLIRNRIISIYNNDGPGLRKREIESYNYDLIKDRLKHIIPNYSIVGLLLRNSSDYRVIKSDKHSILSHRVNSWIVSDTSFSDAKLSNISKILDEGMILWLDKYDDNMRKMFVDGLFDIFERSNISNLLDIIDNKRNILKLIKESKKIDDDVKGMIQDFILILLNYFKDYHIDKLKDIL